VFFVVVHLWNYLLLVGRRTTNCYLGQPGCKE